MVYLPLLDSFLPCTNSDTSRAVCSQPINTRTQTQPGTIQTADILKLRMRKAKKTDNHHKSEEKVFECYDLPTYTLAILNQVIVTFNREDTCFSLTPDMFEKSEVSTCFGKKMKTPRQTKMLMKEYNVSVEDCGRPGIEVKLGFEYILKLTKKRMIDRLNFLAVVEAPDWKKTQQEEVDNGVPEDIYVKFLQIRIPPGLNPRLHERFDYDFLHIMQTYSAEERRIYHTVNEKMLKAKLLALSCFIANPEVLSKFAGWGLLIDFAEDNKIDKSLVEGVIDNWIEGKPIRRLTGVYDRQFYVNRQGETIFRGCIMSTEEEENIVKKLAAACKSSETNVIFSADTHIKFTRETDGAGAELFISRRNSKCVGMAFLHPPNEEVTSFLSNIIGW